MTRYRLPDVLGGGEAELIERKATGYPSFSSLQIDGVVVIVPQEHLTEMPAPLPPEPPIGSIVAAGYPDNPLPLYRRWDEGWYAVGLQDGFSEWAEICALSMERASVAPRLLVPAPEPLQVPWQGGPLCVYVDLNGLGGGPHKVVVSVRGHTAHVTPPVARDAARALWAAADAAQAQA